MGERGNTDELYGSENGNHPRKFVQALQTTNPRRVDRDLQPGSRDEKSKCQAKPLTVWLVQFIVAWLL
jgi:hypothetical protein